MVGHVNVTKRRKGLQADKKRTRRARLKGWRLMGLNLLSAHLFFGALCNGLWRMVQPQSPAVIGFARAPACPRLYGGV